MLIKTKSILSRYVFISIINNNKKNGTVPNSLQKKYIVVQTLHARSVL